MKLSLVLHAHQPPGNFDSVFQRAVDTCYGPVLDLIEERPALRLSLHCSGSLLEWLEQHAPERVDQIRRLVARAQVELVAAGMYEPVLALLPRHDRLGQLRAHRAYLRRRFGVDASVGWLTERVWEPSMAADLVDGGIGTVTLDDRHLLSAGLRPDELHGPYVTESQGKPLKIVPAAEDLRMMIPWHPVEEALRLIQEKARAGFLLAAYADDIEKFGLWPGTYRDVIRSGWLAKFFDGLARLEDVEVLPLGEAAAATPPFGRVYVPDGSYPEMLEWSLPPRAQRAFGEARELLRRRRMLDRVSPFMRVGLYLQFLARYPEVNHLHKRMLDVSQRIAATRRPPRTDDLEAWDVQALPEEQVDLWRAQANCVYWHGLFGGAYLPHLRQRVWHHLLRAERALDQRTRSSRRALRIFDLDADCEEEVVVTTGELVAVIDPSEGAVVELSDRHGAINLVDTLARREEGYHEGDPPYPYDRGRRGWFVDRVLAPGRAPRRRAPIEDLGDFEGHPYEIAARQNAEAVTVSLDREATAPGGRLRVTKVLRIPKVGRVVEARYRLQATGGDLDARFAVELNLGVLFAEQPRGALIAGGRRFTLPRGGAARGVESAELTMEEIGVSVHVAAVPAADLDVRPIETVSRSEGGYERIPQQLAVLLTWPLRLRSEEAFEADVHVRIGADEAAPIGPGT